MILYILLVLAGLITGIIIANVYMRPVGTLKIDVNNPDKDLYFFEFNCALEKLPNRKVVKMKIDPHANLSQE